MVIDTSALLETRVVIDRQVGEAGQAERERLLASAAITPVPLEEAHVHWALEGWRRFGKGRHLAALNFGDCLGYGLARALGAPLLFIGSDFAATVLPAALP